MNQHIGWGLVCGGIFTTLITCIAAFDALGEGGLALASTIFGLAAGVCIGGLNAANFAILAMEEKGKKESAHKPAAELPAAA